MVKAKAAEGTQEPSFDLLTEAPLPEEKTGPMAVARTPEYGDGVFWVDNRESVGPDLKATIMAVFADRSLVNLRVYDAANPYGHFDVHQVDYDADKVPGTWHW